MAVPPVAAQNDTEPAFVVDVNANGSAEVFVRSTFDLTTDSERDAFETLMDDEAAQQDATDRFRDRMRAVASDAENATGREMSVEGASIDLQRSADGDTGIVTLSVTWEGLAAVVGDRLVVAEPFASGFTTERPLVLRAPDGYEIANVNPEPHSNDGTSATWEAGTDLTGFAAELGTVETSTADDGLIDTDGQPGFGILAALIAVLAAAAMVTNRRANR